ncbi:hypothetical protein RB9342 [Rhodopirellula baltica SH 1]|uniref:Uncharacterized protein n=1 Tax=Rhodopirellula baltica (strain DSM 10527 / NCIMB 13988 / SH1) TaxID=243090 RepID=Q7ULR4_RHOBA|nr:hypothetical protein RB9342 [Rhodopirellula baltica SH 1]
MLTRRQASTERSTGKGDSPCGSSETGRFIEHFNLRRNKTKRMRKTPIHPRNVSRKCFTKEFPCCRAYHQKGESRNG